MALATVGSCQVWLGLTAVPKSDRDLLGFHTVPLWINLLGSLAPEETGGGIHVDQPPFTVYPQKFSYETRYIATVRSRKCCYHRATVRIACRMMFFSEQHSSDHWERGGQRLQQSNFSSSLLSHCYELALETHSEEGEICNDKSLMQFLMASWQPIVSTWLCRCDLLSVERVTIM